MLYRFSSWYSSWSATIIHQLSQKNDQMTIFANDLLMPSQKWKRVISLQFYPSFQIIFRHIFCLTVSFPFPLKTLYATPRPPPPPSHLVLHPFLYLHTRTYRNFSFSTRRPTDSFSPQTRREIIWPDSPIWRSFSTYIRCRPAVSIWKEGSSRCVFVLMVMSTIDVGPLPWPQFWLWEDWPFYLRWITRLRL